ncbi:hypothetical protein [Arthrobacter sp. H14]|uniref:hypothetical protein n=1 Tax=Arthrobacter sp. H14 TaxID=1312959 RepID=UPI00047E0537|nr:hypothetical protein [Arthrobacter sp. H14]
MSALSKLLHEANSEGWSARRITAEAEKRGHPVANTSVSKYLRGEPEKSSENVLAALGAALGIPLPKLRAAAGLPSGELEDFVLPPEANRLSRKQRDVVLNLVQVFLDEDHQAGPNV